MVRQQESAGLRVAGLRTRYFPKNRVGHSLVSAAPWLDLLLLIACFIIIDSKFVLQHGVVIELPVSSFKGALATDMVSVIRSVEGSEAGTRREIIFFDDERFLASNGQQMAKLKQAYVNHAEKQSASGMLIYSDRNVSQGTLVQIYNMAKDAGIVRINIASRPEPER